MNPNIHSNRPQLCAVSYLNTIPLVWGLLEGPQRPLADVDFRLPADCADAVRDGQFDAGLLPVIEIARQGLPILSDVGICCRGPVRSILLISKVSPSDIRTLAADTSSRSSVMLARVLLANHYRVEDAEFIPLKPDVEAMLAKADACLVIGDPALHIDPAKVPYQVADLGEVWWQLTGLPMVFAAWAGKTPLPVSLFRDSWQFGMERMDEYVASEATKRGFPEDLAREYLTHHIHYEIGPEERRGLEEYLRLAATMETIPA